jgi:hypothetical protein
LILVHGGIRQFADADAVENDHDGTGKHAVCAFCAVFSRQGWCDEK